MKKYPFLCSKSLAGVLGVDEIRWHLLRFIWPHGNPVTCDSCTQGFLKRCRLRETTRSPTRSLRNFMSHLWLKSPALWRIDLAPYNLKTFMGWVWTPQIKSLTKFPNSFPSILDVSHTDSYAAWKKKIFSRLFLTSRKWDSFHVRKWPDHTMIFTLFLRILHNYMNNLLLQRNSLLYQGQRKQQCIRTVLGFDTVTAHKM